MNFTDRTTSLSSVWHSIRSRWHNLLLLFQFDCSERASSEYWYGYTHSSQSVYFLFAMDSHLDWFAGAHQSDYDQSYRYCLTTDCCHRYRYRQACLHQIGSFAVSHWICSCSHSSLLGLNYLCDLRRTFAETLWLDHPRSPDSWSLDFVRQVSELSEVFQFVILVQVAWFLSYQWNLSSREPVDWFWMNSLWKALSLFVVLHEIFLNLRCKIYLKSDLNLCWDSDLFWIDSIYCYPWLNAFPHLWLSWLHYRIIWNPSSAPSLSVCFSDFAEHLEPLDWLDLYSRSTLDDSRFDSRTWQTENWSEGGHRWWSPKWETDSAGTWVDFPIRWMWCWPRLEIDSYIPSSSRAGAYPWSSVAPSQMILARPFQWFSDFLDSLWDYASWGMKISHCFCLESLVAEISQVDHTESSSKWSNSVDSSCKSSWFQVAPSFHSASFFVHENR